MPPTVVARSMVHADGLNEYIVGLHNAALAAQPSAEPGLDVERRGRLRICVPEDHAPDGTVARWTVEADVRAGRSYTYTTIGVSVWLDWLAAALAPDRPTPGEAEPPPVCPTCDGAGWVSGIGADPLPSGEPGEPYQVQETCPDCGGAGVLG